MQSRFEVQELLQRSLSSVVDTKNSEGKQTKQPKITPDATIGITVADRPDKQDHGRACHICSQMVDWKLWGEPAN